jgi:ferredoxin-NADP reductase
MVLTSIRPAAREASFYTFARPDGACLPSSMAGAHIAVELPNGVMRDYSLVTPLDAPYEYTVCVKLESDGRGSSYLHNKARVGDRLSIALPRNNFPLNEAVSYSVLIAGGIGITPIYSMLTRLSDIGRDWELHYACQTRVDAVFLSELEKCPNVRLHFDDESEGQFLNVSRVVAEAPPEAHLYCCGPTPMMIAFEEAAASEKYRADAVHVEYFKSKFEPDLRGGFNVKLARDGR